MAAVAGLIYNAPVPFKALLKELVSSVEGAEGAIFVEADGEAVQWYTRGEGERLQLRAAYLAVMLQALRATAERLGVGEVTHLVLEYEGARFVVAEIGRGYFIALELDSSANIGQAIQKILPAAASLRREVAV
jgi:predicted regulator of Ras-like GTPase activity (Roadblock/LC7/MglB family)